MKQRILWYAGIIFMCLGIYAICSNNEFATIVSIFAAFSGGALLAESSLEGKRKRKPKKLKLKLPNESLIDRLKNGAASCLRTEHGEILTTVGLLEDAAEALLANLNERNDTQWDGTDAAHPAYWRGEKASGHQFCRLIENILSGKNKCTGRMYEPIEKMRDSVFALKTQSDYAWDRVRDLENENEGLENRLAMLRTLTRKTFKTAVEASKLIDAWEEQYSIAVEQRTADWDRIHSLEKDVENLNAKK